jgi:hypothetical protein
VEGERSAKPVLLGLSGFVLLAVSEYEGEQAIETTADVVGCPGYEAVAVVHGRRPVQRVAPTSLEILVRSPPGPMPLS